MADLQRLKPEKDYSKETDAAVTEASKLAKSNLGASIEKLSQLEKKTRQASDLASTSKILVAIVSNCKDAGDWSMLNEQTQLLSKKHGQLKQAITKMVQKVMEFIPDAPNAEVRLSVIETLRTVTEGKIFVEVERARVTRMLSDIKKQQGDLDAACDILTELQVETFGSMGRREKTEFILAQVALCIEKGDWTQASILSRKISTKYLARKPKLTPEEAEKKRKEAEEAEKKRSVDDPPPEIEDDTTDLKLEFYRLQILIAQHDARYLDACKHYRQLLDTEAVEEDPVKLKGALERVIYYIILAPYDNEQSDLLHRIAQDSRNETIVPVEASLLKLFTTSEIMPWPKVEQDFGAHLTRDDMFSAMDTPAHPQIHQRWKDLRKRVIEHNVRVIAKYYTRITLPRLCQLLNLDEAETEKFLSDLVTNKTVYARIDRPARLVTFAKQRGPDDILNDWSSDMKSLLGLLERIDHLITKEEMMARIAPASEQAKA